MLNNKVTLLEKIVFDQKLPFVLIAGPCAMESQEHAFFMAKQLIEITDKLNIPFIYKSSFDKANRSSIDSERGVGIRKGLQIFGDIKDKYGCPVITDVHETNQCEQVAEVVDILQIPAFLCRQTDLLTAAAKTGKIINVKKGQFMAPWDMKNVAKKISDVGNSNILLCERGSCFGYNRLIVDMTSLTIMENLGYPVIFDGTHSVQLPSGLGNKTGGNREMVPVLLKAAVAVGVAGLFVEVHEDPDNAPSDSANMLALDNLEGILKCLLALDKIAKNGSH